MTSEKIKCAACGALAGAVNGFFGAGGGAVLVPLYVRWVRLEDKRAYATALSVMLPLCIASAAVYFTKTSLDLAAAAPYLIGGFLGGFFGGRIFNKIPVKIVRKSFGLLLIYSGIRSFLP